MCKSLLQLKPVTTCFLAFLILFLTACFPTATPAPTETPTVPAPTAVPTATIVWFPPTPTFTPFPTSPPASPTPDLRTGLGALILEDTFSQSTDWDLNITGAGSSAIGVNELTIAFQEDSGYLYTFRRGPLLTDFYAEITVSPSLCQGEDEYGLLLRAVSDGDFYRYSVSCSGKVRLDRLYHSQASSPQPWLITGSLPIGAPSQFKLAVWAVGKEMRYFINDDYQFTIEEGTLPSGSLGLFAHSTGGHSMTVNFSDLKVYEVHP